MVVLCTVEPLNVDTLRSHKCENDDCSWGTLQTADINCSGPYTKLLLFEAEPQVKVPTHIYGGKETVHCAQVKTWTFLLISDMRLVLWIESMTH